MSRAPSAGAALDRLFSPATIAVVGASASPAKAGHQLLRALDGFPGGLYPVNPAGGEIAGRQVFRSVRDVPEPVDLALLVVPPAVVPAALRDCAAAEVGAAVVCAGGFAEAGDDGAALQAEALGIARSAGMRLLGPNTSGFVNPPAGVRASFVPAASELRPGRLAIVAQSGGVHHALAFAAHAEGLGLHLGVGLGNAVDVGFADVLDHLAVPAAVSAPIAGTEPVAGTDVAEARDRAAADGRGAGAVGGEAGGGLGAVALAIEGVRDGRRLVDAVARLVERVPVVALVVGRADVAELARSHTGAVTGSWSVTRAALRQAGAVVVDDTTELIDAAKALMATRLMPSVDPGVGLVTGQAGPGLLITDGLRSRGIRVTELAPPTRQRLANLLPPVTFQRNPVDTGRPGPEFGDVVATVASDPAVDLTLVYALHEPAALDPLEAVGPARTAGAPVIFATGGPPAALAATSAELADARVATFPTPERATTAVQALVADAQARHLAQASAAVAGATAAGASDERGGVGAVGDVGDARPPQHVVQGVAAGVPRWTAGRGVVDEHEAKSWLEAAGLRVPRRRACASRAEAHAALEGLGPPVAVKVLDPALTHKSDVGGVHLGVVSPDDLERALDAIDAIGPADAAGAGIGARADVAGGAGVATGAHASRAPGSEGDIAGGAEARRYLVEETVEAGVELLVGARRDPTFGPLVALGLGGLAAEVLGDVAVRLAPLATAPAAAMADELAGRALLDGFRGHPPVDRDELAAVLTTLGALLQTHDEVAEIEVNPLFATAKGLVAADALVILRR